MCSVWLYFRLIPQLHTSHCSCFSERAKIKRLYAQIENVEIDVNGNYPELQKTLEIVEAVEMDRRYFENVENQDKRKSFENVEVEDNGKVVEEEDGRQQQRSRQES